MLKSERDFGVMIYSNIHCIWKCIIMAGRKKRPTLRLSSGYWVTTVYKPNGVRGTVSFGKEGDRPASDIRIAFEQWIELYLKQPRKALSFSSPYEALEYIINPTTVTTVGQLFEKYEAIITPATVITGLKIGMIEDQKWLNTNYLLKKQKFRFILQIHIHLGKEVQMRTQMD